MLESALRRWNLIPESPPVHTVSGCVVMVRRRGERLVLKLPRAGDETSARRVLAHYDGAGAVRIVDYAGDGAVLLERAWPGEPLTARVLAGDDDGATAILCAVARRLHRRAPSRQRFARIEDWGLGFQRHRAAGHGGIPAHLLDHGEKVFVELAKSQGQRRLLHGDLHHDNILFDAARGWLAIDPKGVLGEPAYEFGAALRNPTEDPARFATREIIERRVAIIAREAGVDQQRVLGWTFAQAVLSAVWSIEDGLDPARGLATAVATLPLVAEA